MTTHVTRRSFAVLLVWSGNALGGVAALLHSIGKRVDAWFAARERARHDRFALSHMSERELQDIGISRASVEAVADGTWWRER